MIVRTTKRGQIFLLDEEDLDILGQDTWSMHDGYIQRNEKVLHILIAERIFGTIPEGMLVDHRDRIRGNNCRANLRLATPTQNNVNCEANVNKRSCSYKGVYFHKGVKEKPWYARINCKPGLHIGYFATAEEAAKAYDIKLIERYGEFAHTNFIYPE